MLRLIIFTTLIVLLLTNDTRAQNGVTLNGTIVDQNKAVLVNVEVQVLNLASGVVLKTTTNSSGQYSFSGLQRGSHQIMVSTIGFAPVARSVTWRANGAYTEDFELVPGIIETSITVTAAKGSARAAVEIPQNVAVVDQTQIEEHRPAATLRLLDRTPNLTPVNANPALERPRLRGLGSNRLLIILDGERLNNVRSDPTTGVSPSVIDVTQLEAVEVLSGAGSGLYGSDALGGIINLVTKSPARSDGAQRLSLKFDGDLHTNDLFRRGALT